MFSSTTAVLLIYLGTTGASSGVSITSAEFGTVEACEAAGRRAKAELEGFATRVRWACSLKASGTASPAATAPQSR